MVAVLAVEKVDSHERNARSALSPLAKAVLWTSDKSFCANISFSYLRKEPSELLLRKSKASPCRINLSDSIQVFREFDVKRQTYRKVPVLWMHRRAVLRSNTTSLVRAKLVISNFASQSKSR